MMLNVVSTQKALEIIREQFSCLRAETQQTELSHSLGLVLSEDVISSENIPSFNRSTVDGYAVKSADTFGSSESIPSQLTVIGEILMGEAANIKIGEGECVKISTGGMLPEGADSVVMVEHTDSSFEDFCLVYKAVSPFENVTQKGDDIKENEVALKKGTVISSRETGILACLGKKTVKTCAQPRVGIISTGDEIVPIESKAETGKIRDINSHILESLMRECGCQVKQYGIVKDNYEDILSSVKRAAVENDIILVSGGSSAGARDMTAQIISELGQVFFHGIAMKPGKPTILGEIGGKAVFGLPGHPTAAYFVALRFVKDLVDMMLSRVSKDRELRMKLTQNISSNHGREEIVCVKTTCEGAVPVFGKSGIISLLSESDGFIVIDRNSEGLKKGDEAEVILF